MNQVTMSDPGTRAHMEDANDYRVPWLLAVASTPDLSADALSVAALLADCITGISARVFVHWRGLNMRLGRAPGDKAILSALLELQGSGLLGRNHPWGYQLIVPAKAEDE